jgi:hypothetical protein
VQYVEASGHLIRFKQKKTGSETLPITEQAYGLLGERKQSLEKVLAQ